MRYDRDAFDLEDRNLLAAVGEQAASQLIMPSDQALLEKEGEGTSPKPHPSATKPRITINQISH